MAEQSARKLSPRALSILDATDDERIQHINEAVFIPYKTASDLIVEMDELLLHPKTERMPNLLIVARSNNGKTEILKEFLKRHPVEDRAELDTAFAPVVYIQCPPGPSEHIFLNEMLKKLGLASRINDSADRKLMQVIEIFRMIKTKVLLVDELNALLAGSVTKQRFFLNMLKYLSNELKISIVAAGTKDAVYAVRTDNQIENRFPIRSLPRWQENEDFRRLLASFEYVLPLKNPSGLHKLLLTKQLYGLSDGIIGELAKILRDAAKYAITMGIEQITEEVIDACPYVQRQKNQNLDLL